MRPGRTVPYLCVALVVSLAVAWGPAASAGVDRGSGVDGRAGTDRCGAPPRGSAIVVATDRGAVEGRREQLDVPGASRVAAWRGIPYAAPPIGERRWRPPQAATCRDAVFDASEFGPECPQVEGGSIVGDEDCLTLNVWRPLGGKQPRAVMVFVHGGGHVQGSASKQAGGTVLYDGAALAAQGDVVVVTIQYRLGALGWLAADPLANGSDPAGNYGLLDQVAALEWVQRNIASFGGDPERVTVFGESAGAVDTCLLVTSPLAEDLFSRAIMQSGACVAADRASASGAAERFTDAAGCGDAAQRASCLRGLPLDTVMRTLPGSIEPASIGRPLYGPYVDGRVLPEAPLDRIRAGRANDVAVIVGSNADETAQMVRPLPETPEAYAAAVTALVGTALTPRVLEAYPVERYASPGAALVAVTTDARFTCTARTAVQALVEGQSQPVYRYFFTHTMDGGALAPFGAFHGLELFFVFGKVASTGYEPSAAEEAVSDAMIAAWSRFAETGEPRVPGGPEWPAAAPGSDPYLAFNTAIAAGDGVRTEQCDFWAGLRGSQSAPAPS